MYVCMYICSRIDPSWGGPIELFLVPASPPQLVYVLSCLWDGAYKITLAANRKCVCVYVRIDV